MNAAHTPHSALASLAALVLLAGSTHGLAQSPQLVRDINPRPAAAFGSSPTNFFSLGNRVLFIAGSREHGAELWRTDGTAAGTTLLKDIQPGPIGSHPRLLAIVGNRALLAAGTATTGEELWVTDGTPDGTILLGDLAAGRIGSAPGNPVVIDGVTHFSARVGTPAAPSSPADTLPFRLLSTDGTPAGTANIADGLTSPIQVGRRVLFAAPTSAASTDIELFALDLDTSARTLIADLLPGSVNGSIPANLTVWDGNLAFTLTTDASGPQIWLLNLTTATAQRLTNLSNTPNSGGPAQLTILNNRLYFTADTPDAGREAWVIDDTPFGASMLPELAPGAQSSFPQGFTALDATRVIYSGFVPSSGHELAVTGGTPATTSLVRDIGSNLGGSSGGQLTAAAGRLYFTAALLETGLEPYRSDGTAAGTNLIADLVPGPNRSFVRSVVANNADAAILWRSAGPNSGTTSNLPFDDAATPPRQFTVPGIVLPAEIAFADNGTITVSNSSRVFQTNGVSPLSSASALLTGLPGPDVGPSAFPPVRFPYAGGWVFVSDSGIAGHIFQRSPTSFFATGFNGSTNFPVTAAIRLGPGVVADGSFSSQLELRYLEITLSPTNFPIVSNSRLLRTSPPDPTLPRLAAARTHLTALTSSLAVFTTYDPALGRELWRTDGTVAGTTLLKDINPGPASARIDGIIALGNRALLAASDGAAGHELWITDGTTAGTVLLKDINPGPASSEPRDFTLAAGKVYFSADDGAAGRELWVTDGTPAGTTRVFDLFPGPVGSNPRNMTDVRGTLFFYADDGIVGDELFSLVVGNASCNLADVTGPGGPPSGPDGQITGDDFVAFIAAFAEGRPGLADVTGIGGEPAIPDGLITGDDFIAFIAAFATGCP